MSKKIYKFVEFLNYRKTKVNYHILMNDYK